MLKNVERADAVRRALPVSIQYPLKKVIKGYRFLTRGLRLLPDYLVIGARRCGTTSLYNYLIQHPNVLPALTKEVSYFDAWFGLGDPWYRAHFPLSFHKRLSEMRRGGRVLTGEASPSYLFDPLVPVRAQALLPDAKVIVLLRNPVDAIYSAYNLGLRHGTYAATDVSFEACVTEELANGLRNGVGPDRFCSSGQPVKPFLPQGIYVDPLSRWLDLFPREQIRVLMYEDFFRDVQQGYKQVLSFLGLPPHELPAYPVYNHVQYSSLSQGLRKQLIDFYAPHNERLRELLNIPIGWDV